MLENKEQDRGTSGKVDNKWSTRKTMNTSDSRFHHKVAISSRKECNIGGIQSVFKNITFL